MDDEDSIRSTLEQAFEEHTDEPAAGKPAAERSEPGEGAGNGGGDGTRPAIESKDTLPKDEKSPAEEVAKDEKKVEGEEQPKGRTKAPASWKAEEREGWEATPEPAKAAILRREREVDTALRESSAARQFAQQFMDTIAPYRQYIAADNSTPLVAVRNMMQTAAILSGAPPGRRAAEVARMIQHFGIDVNLLDEALAATFSGKQPATDPNEQLLRLVDQRLAPVQQFIQQSQSVQAQQTQQLRDSAATEWGEFSSKPEFEYAEDVREDMADILDLAARRGQTMDLSTAYARATMLHPTISKLIEQKNSAKSAAQQTAAARRAKDAAASLGSSAPSREAGSDEDGGSIREALASSITALANRR
jgi:hypothetical protein